MPRLMALLNKRKARVPTTGWQDVKPDQTRLYQGVWDSPSGNEKSVLGSEWGHGKVRGAGVRAC